MSVAQAMEYAEKGFRYIFCGTDLMFFGRACTQMLQEWQGGSKDGI